MGHWHGIYRVLIIYRNLWALVRLAISWRNKFWFFKSPQHLNTLEMQMDLVFVLKWVKSIIKCVLFIFHLSDLSHRGCVSSSWKSIATFARAITSQKKVKKSYFRPFLLHTWLSQIYKFSSKSLFAFKWTNTWLLWYCKLGYNSRQISLWFLGRKL